MGSHSFPTLSARYYGIAQALGAKPSLLPCFGFPCPATAPEHPITPTSEGCAAVGQSPRASRVPLGAGGKAEPCVAPRCPPLTRAADCRLRMQALLCLPEQNAALLPLCSVGFFNGAPWCKGWVGAQHPAPPWGTAGAVPRVSPHE